MQAMTTFEKEIFRAVADPAPLRLPADEVELLKHFRKIPVRSDKKTVVSVARLATRKN